MIVIICPVCHTEISVRRLFADKQAQCPACGLLTPVPSDAQTDLVGDSIMTPKPSSGGDLIAPQSTMDRRDPPTDPPRGNADATISLDASALGHESSLTDFLARPEASDELGRLGKYRILKILGAGGMGVVYQAEDPQLKRTVAIKAMLPTFSKSASAGKRFLREAQALAAVEHDHIVRIYQVDEDRGVPFLAMEFLKGAHLEDRLTRGPELRLTEIVRIGREVAEALGAAHAAELIHRDIKPRNIWLEARRDRVKVFDFGLARPAYADSSLTQLGAIIGTPGYMAPEQGRGEVVDARCDLFSLGIVLYRLVTGHPPFQGDDNVAKLLAVAAHNPPPPISINRAVPMALSDLVMKLLEKDPANRSASADEVVQALQELEIA